MGSTWGVWTWGTSCEDHTTSDSRTGRTISMSSGFYFDVAITNAFILHSFDVTSSPLDHKSFRLKLAEQLIGDYMSRKKPGRPRKRSRPTPHLPTHSKSRRCTYCRDMRSPPRRKESAWMCTACEGDPQLCLTGKEDGSDCFRLWHGL